MAFDVDGYRKNVVDPARKNGVPRDLFTRYALDETTAADQALFRAHIEQVVRYWRSLKLKKTHAAIAEALIAAHAELDRADELTAAAFTRARARLREEEQAKLERLVTALAAASPCISAAMFDRLVAGVAGVFDAATVLAALRRHDLRVIERTWDIPDEPPSTQARSLRSQLAVLGLGLSVELVLGADRVRGGFHLHGGFRLAAGSEVISEQVVTRAREARAGNAQDERQTAAENIFVIVLAALRGGPAGYDALVRWEVVEALRAAVDARLPARAVADQAAALGLVRAEADELAVTLVETSAGPAPFRGLLQEVYDALASGRLHAAQQLVAGLPEAERAEVGKQVEAARSRLLTLVREADQAAAAGRPEDCAVLLAQAVEVAVDADDLRARLRSIPPPAPPAVAAGVDGGRVTVRWTPSPARTGEVRYRLVRGSARTTPAPGAGSTVAETAANTAVDDSPPVGEPVSYTVYATREDGIWSPGGQSAPVLLAPDVSELSVVAQEDSVRGSWRAGPGVHEVSVVRTGAGGSGPGVAPTTVTSVGFLDSGLRTGTAYEYRVRAVYLGRDGSRHTSAGLVAVVRPQRPPDVVSDLAVELREDAGTAGPTAVATWTPPRTGLVEIRLAATAPRWAAGARVPVAQAARYGVVVPGLPVPRADGRVMLPLRARQGRCYVTAVTSVPDGSTAAVGNTAPLALVDAVTGLTTNRFGDAVRLRWDWPDGATHARIEWWPMGRSRSDGPVAGQSDIRRRRYTDDGGAEIRVGPRGVTIAVRTVVTSDGAETTSLPVTADVPGGAIRVTYGLRGSRLPWRRRAVLTMVCEQSCRLPPMVVVGRPDGILPLSAAHGTAIVALDARDLVAREKTVVALRTPRRDVSGLACFVDPNGPPDPGCARVTLVRSHRTR